MPAARTDNKRMESDILSKLYERFLPIVSLNIQAHKVLRKHPDMEEKCREITKIAISEVERLYPLNSNSFSVKRAVYVLHNVVDKFIANTLYEKAKNGESDAEEYLFSLLRKKLIIYLKNKIWGS